jgi:HD-like signal output (HDOD) protein
MSIHGKRRLIFGDEEVLSLGEMQRHALALANDWEFIFLETGRAILEHLEDAPCDVLIASASLPDMAPQVLLKGAKNRRPDCVRMVMAGSTAQDRVLPCVGLLHQAFPRTNDPQQILVLVSNAIHISQGMIRHPEVKAAITTLERLPSVPKVYQELRSVLEGRHATYRDVGAVIQRDMGMTAKVLKLINSAFFGLQRRVESPQEAVHFLGMDVVQALVLAHGIFDQTGSLGTRRISIENVWDHSLRVAKGARTLAAMEGLSRHQTGDAFMGGLLHDVGILILAKAFPAVYDQVVTSCETEQISLKDAERNAFGLTHAEVGAYLLGLWGIQTGVLEAVSLHHTPSSVQRTSFDHVLAVHVADEFSKASQQHPVWERTTLDDTALERLGLMDCIQGWKDVMTAPGW